MGITYSTFATPRLDLGEALQEFSYDDQFFVAEKVLAPFAASKKSATFSVHTREGLLKVPNALRTSTSQYNRTGTTMEDLTYTCKEYGLEDVLGDDDSKLFSSYFDAELATSKAIQLKLLLNQEVLAAAALFNTSTFTGSSLYTDISTVWSTVASADVLGDVANAKLKIQENTGMVPDTLVVNATVYNYIKRNAAILAAVSYTRFPSDTQANLNLCEMFGIKRICVAGAVKDTASKGNSTSTSAIWSSSYALLCRTAQDGDNLSTPCVGRTVRWTDDMGNVPYVVENYRDESRRGTVYRVRQSIDSKIFDANQGHLLKID
jgi:hypothetical protein